VVVGGHFGSRFGIVRLLLLLCSGGLFGGL
jgi:hypothetical protein